MAPKKAASSSSKDKGGDKKGGSSEKGGSSGKLGTCKEVNARHILCEKMGKAEEVMKKLQDGWLSRDEKVPASEFAKLAEQYSDCSSKNKGGSLGWFGRGKMVGAFQDVAFNTPVGEVSKIFKTEHGYHIVLVEGRRN
ncbi:hypothetical protein C9374_009565 [Naegleria lovaniensis]|uniref:Peptidyl-prolyl cis-trans isomerase n=1 Tax=Naegleria lovaniensis TaxID=51637 RepID=A0AA88GXS7_NAELO|nr:uncharacterized protein C9374_009565 [Naegleria lovaniensis]KAG2392988.1 hypothetical protein C9374_009565 [Naegleria lovaniensis]